MCTLAAASLNIFHPGHFLEEPATEPSEQSLRRQSREKTRGYSMMADESALDLEPPQPSWVGNVKCVRCAVQDDRRSWI